MDTHVALLSSPGLGHLIPVIELGKHLALHCNFHVTILAVISPSSQAESKVLKSAMSTTKLCHFIEIPCPDVTPLLHNKGAIGARLCLSMREATPAIRTAITNMTHPPSVLIVDVFGFDCLSIAQDLNMPNFIYVASNAWFFSLLLYTPILHHHVQGQYVDQQHPLLVPGCNPVRPEDVIAPMRDRYTQQYQHFIGQGLGMLKADGVLINTWEELQHRDLQSLRDENLLGGILKVPVYAIGPLVRHPEPPTPSTTQLLEWLDQQPPESVVYVSFGSGGTMSFEQTTEIAVGLELSGMRFIWVVRPPNTTGSADSAFFSTGDGTRETDDPVCFLPEGFLDRTHKVGRVVPQWAPQVTILNHPSVGGFLSHCGWSSSLESITNGVPMVVWPLYAEQAMNATLLAEHLGVAVRPKVLPTKKVVEREEIASMLRDIMEVEKHGKPNPIKKRVKELKESAKKALEEGGSSMVALAQFAKQCEPIPNGTMHYSYAAS